MIHRSATHACGTRFELVLADDEARADDPSSSAARRLRAAAGEALAAVEEVDRTWSLFRRDSLLARINRRAAAAPVRLDQDAYELLADALAVWRASGRAFDPGLAPYQQQRGLHAGSHLGERAVTAGLPGAEAVVLDPDARTVRFTRPGVALDLGGIAKGHALDLAAAVLREAGVRCAFLHGGTSAGVALGAPPARAGWTVALGSSDGPRLQLRDQTFALSRAAGRLDPRGAAHIVEPFSGVAVPAERSSFCVAPTARLADAWATALVARPEQVAASWPSAFVVGVSSDSHTWRTAGDDALLDRTFHLSPSLPGSEPLAHAAGSAS